MGVLITRQGNTRALAWRWNPSSTLLYLSATSPRRTYRVVPEELLSRDLEELDRAVDALLSVLSTPSTETFLSLLKICLRQKSIYHAKRIRECLNRHRILLSGFLGDYLVVTLARCGDPIDAWNLSCSLPRRTVFSWSAIISSHVDHGQYSEALKLYGCMQNENVPLNKFTLVSLFKACGMVQDLLQGRELHEYARKRGLTTDPYVGSTLVSMYGRCGTVTDAENAFCELSHPDIVSWTSLLSAYVEQGDGEKALLLYRQMLEEGIGKAELPLVIALKACGILAEKDAIEDQPVKLRSRALALALHADARAKGAISGLLVGNTLVSTYGKCRAIAESEATFCSMSFHDVVSWNVMLSAYVDGFKVVKALQLYCQMQKEKVDAELLTFVILLQACSALAKQENSPSINGHSVKLIVPEIAKALQADAHRRDLETDISVGSALLDVYRKCGNIHEAEDIFNKLSHRNAVSWTTLLFAYVEGGAIDKALTLYVRMREEEVGLDPIALVSVLQVCRECGASQLCNHIHFIVISLGYDHISGMQTSIICTYGNCGSMGDAQSVFDGLLVPDNVSWSACVDGHASAGSSSKGLHSYECFVLGGQKPDEIMLTSVLSGCCYSGLSTVGAEYFDSLNQDFAINLNLKHYSVLLDLLGRTGDLNRAESLLKKMPVKADLPVWLSILGACRTHGHVQLAQCAFYHAVKLEPKSASVYILMSNIYADAGLQNGVEEVERLRWEQAAWDDE